MNAVIDPSMLFISDQDWNDDEKRDEFLERTHSILNAIAKNGNIKIYWDDKLETYFWESPHLVPWRIEKSYRNSLLTFIPKLFQANVEYIEYENEWEPCFITPALIYIPEKENILQDFLKLMHEMIDRIEDVFFCVGAENQEDEYRFDCNCHDNYINPKIIKCEKDFLQYINLETELWPKNINEFDKFESAILLTKKIYYRDREFRYSYSFSDKFKRNIVEARVHRLSILKQLTKKLVLSYQESTSSDLNDEYISQNDIYRIRVTQRPSSTRIQYAFNKQNNEVVFKSYSPEGHHDDALR